MATPVRWIIAGLVAIAAGQVCAADADDVLFDLRAAQQKLRHTDAAVRLRGAEALGQLGPDAAPAAKELARALGDESLGVQRAAAAALVRVGPAAVLPVAEALADPDEIVRCRAAGVLVELVEYGADAAPAVPALVPALHDESAAVRERVCDALGVLGPDASEAADSLVVRLADDVPAVQRAAIDALSQIDAAYLGLPVIERAPPDNDEVLRLRTAELLWRVDALPETLREVLEAQFAKDHQVRREAEVTLARIVENHDYQRRHAEPDAADPLLEALSALYTDDDPRVQERVAILLFSNWPDERVTVEALAELIVGRQPEDVQRLAMGYLVRSGGPKATVVSEMTLALSDRDDAVRLGAVRVLEQCGKEAEPARDRMLQMLDEETSEPVLDVLWRILQMLDADEPTP